jgi:hypothetical protein
MPQAGSKVHYKQTQRKLRVCTHPFGNQDKLNIQRKLIKISKTRHRSNICERKQQMRISFLRSELLDSVTLCLPFNSKYCSSHLLCKCVNVIREVSTAEAIHIVVCKVDTIVLKEHTASIQPVAVCSPETSVPIYQATTRCRNTENPKQTCEIKYTKL